MVNPTPKCELCGHSMPEGEEMFKFHGYSGPCPSKEVRCPAGEAGACATCVANERTKERTNE